FPLSIILCGVRDVRDYRITQESGEVITGGSAFNIKAESLRMGNFSEDETRQLILQHTKETRQQFDEEIFPNLWEDTKGQPWLINALGHQMTWKDESARDRNVKIDIHRYFAARERLIQSRATHLDQLADKLKEDRVKRVIEPLLEGEQTELNIPLDDILYNVDIGLIVRKPNINISNKIYQEIIPRELVTSTQETMIQNSIWYIKDDNSLDMKKLIAAFQQFFRENSESWIERFDYKEAGPQLLMQAFLQRVINGGGRLNREYGLGRKRTDLLIEWPLDPTQTPEKGLYGTLQRVVIELKILRCKLSTELTKALEQSCEYGDKAGADEVHIVFFDRDKNRSWDDKIWHKIEKHEERDVDVWGC
ncbi:MAG: ATP-binding protein, partial [Desulfamplus sp.]|nr:ATP-binding protein [Desulfamplus sp.]